MEDSEAGDNSKVRSKEFKVRFHVTRDIIIPDRGPESKRDLENHETEHVFIEVKDTEPKETHVDQDEQVMDDIHKGHGELAQV